MARRSTAVQLTLLPMLASAAVAAADPPGATEPVQEAAGQMAPVLQPPGMTPTIDERRCEDDPNWRLRDDCPDDQAPQEVYYYDGGYIRGGFGWYFGGGGPTYVHGVGGGGWHGGGGGWGG